MAYLKHGDTPPKRGRGSALTGKQLRFVEEYLIDCNATKATLRAGYQTKNPNRIGTQLLQHPLVGPEIQRRLDKREERMTLKADYIINRLIEKAEESLKDGDQIRALELLGKTLGLFKERQEISGPDGKAIEIEEKKKNDAEEVARAIARLTTRAGTAGVVGQPDGGSEGSSQT